MSDPLTGPECNCDYSPERGHSLGCAWATPRWRAQIEAGPAPLTEEELAMLEEVSLPLLRKVGAAGSAGLVAALLAEVRAGRHLSMLCWCKGEKHTGEPLCVAAVEAIRAAERGERPVQPEGLSGYWWCGLCLRWYSFLVSECDTCKAEP